MNELDLKKVLEALGQRNQLQELGVPEGVTKTGEDILREDAELMAERGPASIDTGVDQKQRLMDELAALKMGMGEDSGVDVMDDAGEMPVEEAPDKEMKMRALQDLLMKMGK